MRPADFGPFVPIDAQPAKAVQNRRQRRSTFRSGVGVVDAQQELAAMPPGKQPIEQRRANAADVQIAGRAGSETSANHDHPISLLSCGSNHRPQSEIMQHRAEREMGKRLRRQSCRVTNATAIAR